MALAWVGLKAARSESAANRCFQLQAHVGEGAVYTSSSPIPTTLHILSCQHTAASDDIHINNFHVISVKIYKISLKMNQNRSETCAYVTPRVLSIELKVLGI